MFESFKKEGIGWSEKKAPVHAHTHIQERKRRERRSERNTLEQTVNPITLIVQA